MSYARRALPIAILAVVAACSNDPSAGGGGGADAADVGMTSDTSEGGSDDATHGSVDDTGGRDDGDTPGDDVGNAPDDAGETNGDMGDEGPPPGPDPECEGGESDGTLPDGTIAGAITTPHPTLRNVTVEWAIEGDENANGEVRVRYRRTGTDRWRPAMPLRRVPAATLEGHSWTNRHTGSVFDLEPGTSYDIELWLQDPDGGCRYDTVTVQTRPVPEPMPNAPIIDVTPQTLEDALSDAQPGDIIELGAGTYDGFRVTQDGEEGREIVIRSTQGAVVNGTVDASDRSFVQIVGLTANRIRFDHSRRVSIMRNTVTLEEQFDSIGAWNRAEDAYIADNDVTGATVWYEGALGVSGDNWGECIIVTGPGHVIEHNRISRCRDNISFMEGDNAEDQYSIDVIGNDISEAADDGIEADFCAHNCRIMRNRLTNVFIALSSQPGLGGPTYFIRNIVYSNLYRAAFKLHRGSIGDVVLHNTVVKMGDALGISAGREHSAQLFRNNLFIGGEGGSFGGYDTGNGRIVWLPDAVDPDLDFDGLGSEVGNFSGRIGSITFDDFDELRSQTTYANAVQVSLDVFGADVAIPTDPFPGYDPIDLTLSADGAAVDRGEVLHNINDGHAGAAPDLGAYEVGESPPVYGPRP